MGKSRKQISDAINQLDVNLSEIARVQEWSEFMGYKSPQKFGYKFLRHFKVRPAKVLTYVRLISVITYLRSEKGFSNFEIAITHSFPDDKALNSFTNYHLKCSPSKLKSMSDKELNKKFQKLRSNIWDQNLGVKLRSEQNRSYD